MNRYLTTLLLALAAALTSVVSAAPPCDIGIAQHVSTPCTT